MLGFVGRNVALCLEFIGGGGGGLLPSRLEPLGSVSFLFLLLGYEYKFLSCRDNQDKKQSQQRKK